MCIRDRYYSLFENDEEFRDLFKVRADFSDTMPRDAANEQAYAEFVAARSQEEKLRPFGRAAVAKIVEHGARLAEHQCKLSTRFGAVADLVREADYWAGTNGHETVTAEDVQQSLDERAHRANLAAEQLREEILEGLLFIATEDEVVGQVNGLSVLEIGEFSFGHPSRITARTFMGDDGVIHIERETDMSLPDHDKGVLTVSYTHLSFYGNPVFRIVRRDEFDHWLVRTAESLGVTVRQGEAVTAITPGDAYVEVTTDRAVYHAKVLVAADGSRSFVRRKLKDVYKRQSQSLAPSPYPLLLLKCSRDAMRTLPRLLAVLLMALLIIAAAPAAAQTGTPSDAARDPMADLVLAADELAADAEKGTTLDENQLLPAAPDSSLRATFTTQIIEAPIPFNAVVPHWTGDAADLSLIHI